MPETYIFFTSQYFPHVGGVERYTINLARRLKADGHRVIIITNTPLDAKTEEEDEFEILRIPSIAVANDRLRFYLPSATLKSALEYIRPIENARVIVQTMLYQMSLLGVKVAYENGWPCIVITHGSNYVCSGSSPVDVMERVYERTMARLISRYCGNIYSVSNSAAKYLEVLSVPGSGVLYNSINHQQIEQLYKNSSEDIRAERGISPDSFMVCYIGRLIKEKGIVELINAVTRLRHEGNNVDLIVAGNGPLYSDLCSSNSKIHFLGEVPQEKVVSILKSSDTFALPSYSEGFPTSVMEAIICQCYCIVSPYGGTTELIPDNNYGYVMPGKSEEDIYRAIKYAMGNKDKLDTACQNSCKRFYDNFTWEHTIKKIYDIFDNMKKN